MDKETLEMISILAPSRERIHRLGYFLESALTTSESTKNVEILLYVDSDDPQVDAYKRLGKLGKDKVKVLVGEPKSVSKSWNDLAARAQGDILMMGNDDQMFKTLKWDTKLYRAVQDYKDDIYVAWFEDGINGENHCAFPIVSRKWYETLRYFTPGVFNFGYNDTWIFDIGKKLDRCCFIPDVFVEHLHFTARKSPYDNTYARNRTQERGNLYQLDASIWSETEKQREQDAQKLRKVMHGHT
jgi:glycosyl transferase/beta-hydroxylase protein BlmF